jgi:hypothetical protein
MGTNRWSMMIHRPGMSAPWTRRRHNAKPSSVQPIAEASPIGIGLSSDSGTPIEPGTWPYLTGPEVLTLVKYVGLIA